jgi:hypothetical protein
MAAVMLKKTNIGLAIISAVFLFVPVARAQPASGLYQIFSGRYTECCGVGGAFIYPLPYNSQGFVELTIDPQSQRAQMTFVGQDMHTVFQIPPLGPRNGFTFSLSNGLVLPDRIDFGGPLSPPGQPPLSYTVSNSANTLQINGTLTLSCLTCADLPTQFKHTNVVATLLPARPVIEGLEQHGPLLRFRFTGEPPYDYFVEFSESLPATQWLSLTNYRAKLQTIEAVVTDSLTNWRARFYRVRKQDCQCD